MGKRSLLESVLGTSPYLEVLVRQVYWRSDVMIGAYKNIKQKIKKSKKESKALSSTPFADVVTKMRDIGIGSGDLLIVHSGYGNLKCCNTKPEDIINSLMELVGHNGTLALPTHPQYPGTNKVGKEYVNDEVEEIVEFNVKETKAWTGAIPNTFLSYPGTIRSRHPINTMAVNGPLASRIVENNIEGYKPLPCGANSSWKYCADNNAKIVGLGVDLVKSLTMIHVAEDTKTEEWPVEDWYRDRKFIIVDGEYRQELVVRERRPKWVMYYAEKTLRKDLLKAEILQSYTVGDVLLEVIPESKKLIEFLVEKNKTGYPYFLMKRKHI